MSTASGATSPQRRNYAALLLSLLALSAAAAGTGNGLPLWPAGVLAWLAGAVLWPQLARSQQRQALWLVGIGVAAVSVALLLGGRPVWSTLLTQNTALLGMLTAVSFLQMLSPPEGADTRLPRGKGALWRTLLGVHLLGAIINLSAVFIMADRMGPGGKPTVGQAAALTRAFLAAALWSPFFAATAVALTYAPGTNPLHLALIGSGFAAVLLYLAGRDIIRQTGNQAADFVGYPLRPSALLIPGILAVLVIAGHWLLPTWASLSVVSSAALGVVCLSVMWRQGVVGGCRSIADHAGQRLPNMAGELILFLSAGTFASGVMALIGTGEIWIPFTHFGAIEAAVVLAAMILLAIIGIHTVISITLVASWLAPVHPEPLLLALVFVQSWAIGLAASPLSGIHLAIHGRYAMSSALLARNNLGYCIKAYVAAVLWLWLVGALID